MIIKFNKRFQRTKRPLRRRLRLRREEKTTNEGLEAKREKGAEAGACHKCAQHRILLGYNSTMCSSWSAGLVLQFLQARSCAMEALGPLRNGCTFLLPSRAWDAIERDTSRRINLATTRSTSLQR